ncbi:MAG: Holliday junction resolvase RuvX [Nitrincola lacisaponensis]|uniref:Putative pre-16S rRNA nuclease n=1 Tax=Nitrincola lacisaponensis TaxID=267850 RepID=A0A063Y4R9_9GAMM|nr:Holliday junction resolvase RuvX [Nitrincola lacisaponensis]KDE40140.1 putative Holliday junction resolvase YqgF [Nitrincola lacisaponensis]
MQPSFDTALGFDFGTRRIGVAFGQRLTGTASPLEPLNARDGIPDWVQLEKLIQTWQPDCLVIGIPLNMDGTISDMARRARKFANRLHERCQRPCFLMDERLTTREAKQLHRAAGGGQNYRKDPVDSIAARLILEDWFADAPLIPSHTPLESLYGIG